MVGWGVAGAVGAKLAFPNRPVVLLSGDGAMGFGLAELETASRHGISFVAVVADDRAWGIVQSSQKRAFGRSAAVELGEVDFVKVAEGLGVKGLRAESFEEVVRAVGQGIRSEEPVLVHVPIEPGGPADLV